MNRTHSLAGTPTLLPGCWRGGDPGASDIGRPKVRSLTMSAHTQISVVGCGGSKLKRVFFSILYSDWKENIFVKLISWDSGCYFVSNHGFHFSQSGPGFSPFILLHVPRPWPHDQWDYFVSGFQSRGCNCLGAPCWVPGHDKLSRELSVSLLFSQRWSVISPSWGRFMYLSGWAAELVVDPWLGNNSASQKHG